jgi:glycosyltransferase involved in cell wall biosynthesis
MAQPEELIRISVVVCTRNRVEKLRRAMEAAHELTFPLAWELVIVDNGSTDGTDALLSDFRSEAKIPFRVVVEPRPGLAKARNAGWRAARGDLVAFTDDDCYPASDWLEQLHLCFSETDIGFLGGRVLLYDARDYPITIQESQRRVEVAPGSLIRTGLIHGANFAFKRAVLAEIGGFDPLFGVGACLVSGEDCDALARASFSGHRGAYDPRPVVYHHHGRRTPKDVSDLHVGYDIGRGAYYVKGLLDARMRSAFLRDWASRLYRDIRHRNIQRIGRELKGAARYLKHMPRGQQSQIRHS